MRSSLIPIVITECLVYICDFHREQAWTRWVSKIQNGVSHEKDLVLSMLRHSAHACSEEQYRDAVQKLQETDIWHQKVRLRNWFSKTWMPESKVEFINDYVTN